MSTAWGPEGARLGFQTSEPVLYDRTASCENSRLLGQAGEESPRGDHRPAQQQSAVRRADRRAQPALPLITPSPEGLEMGCLTVRACWEQPEPGRADKRPGLMQCSIPCLLFSCQRVRSSLTSAPLCAHSSFVYSP